jgi:hypothetical protein
MERFVALDGPNDQTAAENAAGVSSRAVKDFSCSLRPGSTPDHDFFRNIRPGGTKDELGSISAALGRRTTWLVRGLAADQPLLSPELPPFFRNTAGVSIPEEVGATGRRADLERSGSTGDGAPGRP